VNGSSESDEVIWYAWGDGGGGGIGGEDDGGGVAGVSVRGFLPRGCGIGIGSVGVDELSFSWVRTSFKAFTHPSQSDGLDA
jgi:hypothetical protein